MRRVVMVHFLALALVGWTRPGPVQAGETVSVQVRAVQRAVLAAGMSARLTSLRVLEGAQVAKGDPLFAFDCVLPRLERDKSCAVMEGARVKVAANERMHALDSVGLLELETSRAEARVAEAEFHLAQARLTFCEEVAPFDGQVVALHARNHQHLRQGDPVLELVDVRSLRLEMLVPSMLAARLSPGVRFTARIMETGRAYDAVVQQLGPVVDPVSRTVPVYATLVSPHAELRPGMSGEADLP